MYDTITKLNIYAFHNKIWRVCRIMAVGKIIYQKNSIYTENRKLQSAALKTCDFGLA